MPWPFMFDLISEVTIQPRVLFKKREQKTPPIKAGSVIQTIHKNKIMTTGVENFPD
jgi:hypothetical protein